MGLLWSLLSFHSPVSPLSFPISSLVIPLTHVPSSLAPTALLSYPPLVPSVAPGPSPCDSSALDPSAPGVGLGAASTRNLMSQGATGSSSTPSFADPLLYRDGDDDSDRGDRDLPCGSCPDLPATPSATNSSPWFDNFGNPRFRELRVFLSLFDKLAPLKQQVEARFAKAANDKKKVITALPKWSNVYRLGDLGDCHCAPKVNDSFSRLFDRQVSSSRYLAMSLDESTKLEACVRGQFESRSYSLWAIVAIFTSLKDAGGVPDDETLRHLVSNLTLSLQSQTKALFSAACFLQQKCRRL